MSSATLTSERSITTNGSTSSMIESTERFKASRGPRKPAVRKVSSPGMPPYARFLTAYGSPASSRVTCEREVAGIISASVSRLNGKIPKN